MSGSGQAKRRPSLSRWTRTLSPSGRCWRRASGRLPGNYLGLPELDGDVWADIAGAAAITGARPRTITGWLNRQGPKRCPFPEPRRSLYRLSWPVSVLQAWRETTPGASAVASLSRCRHEGFRWQVPSLTWASCLQGEQHFGATRRIPKTGARGTTRKHVRNDAGTRTSESVMCEFMGQPVVDIRIRRSCRLLRFGAPWPGCRTRVLTVTWPGHIGRSRA